MSLRLVARYGSMPGSLPVGETIAASPGAVGGRAVCERRTIHIEDVLALPETEFPETLARARSSSTPTRTVLATPLLREGVPIGLIYMRRTEVQPFTDKQIELAKTFADQAVIAIENVRLFTELEARNRELTDALEQQTATAEILRVISSSPTDVQPVFDAIVRSAVPLCEAINGAVFRFDGEPDPPGSPSHGMTPERIDAMRRVFPRPPGRGSTTARAILTRDVVHVNIAKDPEYEPEDLVEVGFRTALSVPMLREGNPIGAISVAHLEDRPFTGKQIALLQTFAAQAVIAIENVRLFQELEARNLEVTESLDQQTATAEILRVISSSPTDLQPVMDVVAENAARVCGAPDSSIYRLEGERLRLVARRGSLRRATVDRRYRSRPSRRLTGTARSATGGRSTSRTSRRCRRRSSRQTMSRMRAGRIPHPDVAGHAAPARGHAALASSSSVGGPRFTPSRPSRSHCFETFADQAVIAIENVRLFTELEARNRELTESLEQQTATSEILRVISSSPTDVQPVFDTIVAERGSSVRRPLAATSCASMGSCSRLQRPSDFTPADVEASPEGLSGTAGRGRPQWAGRCSRVGSSTSPTSRRIRNTAIRCSRFSTCERCWLCRCCARESRSGSVVIWRSEVRPFSEAQIELVTDLRRPGGDRHRERAAVHGARGPEPRADRGPRAADRHRRDPAGHLQLADRPPAGDGRRGRECRPILRRDAMPRSFAWRVNPLRFVAAHGPTPDNGADRRDHPRKLSERDGRVRCVIASRSMSRTSWRCPRRNSPRRLARVRQARVPARTMLATPLLREGMPIGVIYIGATGGSALHGQAGRAARRPSPIRP